MHGMAARLGMVVLAACVLVAGSRAMAADPLNQEFNLGGARTAEPQRYTMETRISTYSPDGKRVGTDVLRLTVECVPGANPAATTASPRGSQALQCTCLRFTLQQNDGPERAIPALMGWTYTLAESGYDERRQVFGIDHAKFEGLTDSTGAMLPSDRAYFVYNAFVDFHSICDAFAQPVHGGNGVQSLKRIGQRIVHAAAFSKPPVNLGSNIAEGSYFQNGEITLELKGLSLANGRPCALVGYDSGESAFLMIIKPTPEMEIRATGRSHYWGDIYKNLATNWVEKADLTEAVTSETTLPKPPNKLDTYVERHLAIRNVTGGK